MSQQHKYPTFEPGKSVVSDRGEPNIGQLVSDIIDSLTDSISQLIILAIILQERNAEVPAGLPPAAQEVVKASHNLVNVATRIADGDYKPWPDIYQEMIDSIEGVRLSIESLGTSVNNLQKTTDRRTGWGQLVESCKRIAQETIKLLEIVYEAELKRIMRLAKEANDLLMGLNSDVYEANPQFFCDDAGKTASKLNELAHFLDKRAKGEKQQLLKQKFQDAADGAAKNSKDIIDKANKLLSLTGQEPPEEKKAKEKDFDAKVGQAQAQVAELLDPLRQAALDHDQVFHPPGKDEAGGKSGDKMKNEVRKLENELLPDPNGLSPLERDLMETGRQLALQPLKVQDQVRRGNKPDDALKEFDDLLKKFGKKLGDYQKLKPEEKPLHEFLGVKLKALDKLKGDQDQAAKNPNWRANLRPVGEKIDDTVGEALNAISPEGALRHYDAKKNNDLLDQLKDATGRNDAGKVGIVAPALSKGVDNLKDKGNKLFTEPKKQDDWKKDVDKAKGLLNRHYDDVEGKLKNPRDPKAAQKADESDKEVRRALNAIGRKGAPDFEKNVADWIGKQLRKLDDLKKAKDPSEAQKFADELEKMLKGLRKIGKGNPNGGIDPSDLDEIQRAIDRLKKVIPNIKDPNARNELEDEIARIKARLNHIANGVNPNDVFSHLDEEEDKLDEATAAAIDNDVPATNKALTDLGNKHQRLLEAVKQEANKAPNHHKRNHIMKHLNDLDKAVPEHMNLILKKGNHPENDQDLNDHLDRLRDIIKNLRKVMKPNYDPKKDGDDKDATYYSKPNLLKAADNFGAAGNAVMDDLTPNNKRAQLVENALNDLNNLLLEKDQRTPYDASKALQELDLLADALDKKNNFNPDDLNKNLANTNKKLRDDYKATESTVPEQNKNKLLHALDDLDDLLGGLPAASKAYHSNPNDEQAKKNFNHLKDNIANQLKLLEGLTDPNGGDRGIGDLVKAQQNELKNLGNSLAKGDNQAAQKNIENLLANNQKLNDKLRTHLAALNDPKKRKDVLEVLERLGDSMNDLCKLFGDSLQDNDPKTKKDLQDKIKEINKGLQDVLDVTNSDALNNIKTQDLNLLSLNDALRKAEKNPAKATEAAKAIVAQHEKVKNDVAKLIDRTADPNEKRELQNLMDGLQELLPHQIKATQEVLKDPKNDKKKNDAEVVNNKMREKLADLESKIKPCLANDIKQTARKEETQLSQLMQAAQNGSPQEVDKTLKNLDKTNKHLVDLARQLADQTDDPLLKQMLHDSANNLEKVVNSPAFRQAALDAAQNPNDNAKADKLRNLLSGVKNDVQRIADIASGDADRISKAQAAALAGGAVPLLKSGGQLDPKTKQKLGNAMSAMEIQSKYGAMASNPHEDAQARLRRNIELAKAQAERKRQAEREKNQPPKSPLKKAPNALDSSHLTNLVSMATASPLPSGNNTFEDQINSIADRINQGIREAKDQSLLPPSLRNLQNRPKRSINLDQEPALHQAGLVAQEIQKLATASKEGSKQGMVESAKQISVLINKFSAQILEISMTCKDKALADKLVRANQALKNYSIQLKILAAVKVASKDNAADEQIISLGNSLGTMLTEALDAVKVIKLTQ